MKTTEVFSINGRQAVALPDDIQFGDKAFCIRREGDKVILDPIKGRCWPADFFEAIRVDEAG